LAVTVAGTVKTKLAEVSLAAGVAQALSDGLSKVLLPLKSIQPHSVALPATP
jgi:hypothetical protein